MASFACASAHLADFLLLGFDVARGGLNPNCDLVDFPFDLLGGQAAAVFATTRWKGKESQRREKS